MPKSDLQKGNPLRKTSTSHNQNLKRRGAKQFPFADGIRLTGMSDNHSPKGSGGNALASQIGRLAITSGFLQDVGLLAYEIQQSQRGARGFPAPFAFLVNYQRQT